MTVRLIRGDCRDVLKTLPDASVQCCVTSPPYFGLRNYGVEGQIGLESSVEAYVAEMVTVFREVRRILRPDGVLFLNLGDSYANGGAGFRPGSGRADGIVDAERNIRNRNGTPTPAGLKPKDLIGIPWRVAFALQADGWYLRSDIIWSKPNPMPESVRDRPTKAHEYIFLLSKQPRYFFDAEAVKEASSGLNGGGFSRSYAENQPTHGAMRLERPADNGARNIRSVWTIATAPYAEAHFATFPPELAERCIKAGTSERGACAACGAPWVRVVERFDTGQRQKMTDGWDTGEGGHGTIHRNGREKGEADVPVMGSQTTGWQPTCTCDADIVPCVALDPFGGAGTLGLVADRLQRDAILIELNPRYVDMARKRIVGDAPMLTTCDVESTPKQEQVDLFTLAGVAV